MTVDWKQHLGPAILLCNPIFLLTLVLRATNPRFLPMKSPDRFRGTRYESIGYVPRASNSIAILFTKILFSDSGLRPLLKPLSVPLLPRRNYRAETHRRMWR